MKKHALAALAALLAAGHLAQAQYVPAQSWSGYAPQPAVYYPPPVMPYRGWPAAQPIYPVYYQPMPTQNWYGYPYSQPAYVMPNYTMAAQYASMPSSPVVTTQPALTPAPLLAPSALPVAQPLPSGTVIDQKTGYQLQGPALQAQPMPPGTVFEQSTIPPPVEEWHGPAPTQIPVVTQPAAPSCCTPPPATCEACAGPQPPCHRDPPLYASIDGVFWWTKKAPLPLLVTSGPTVLIGDSSFDDEERMGARVALGGWLDHDQRFGLEAGYFTLGERRPQAVEGSLGTSPVFRPLINAPTAQPESFVVSLPGQAAGNVQVSTFSRLWGSDADLRWRPWQRASWELSFLGGFRYLDLDEGLSVAQTTINTRPRGSSLALSDEFGTHNQFFGGELGAAFEWRWKWLFVDLHAKTGLGDMHEVVKINGTSTVAGPRGIVSQPFGLLAGPANSGHFSRDVFAVEPEAGLDVGVQLNRFVRLHAGYSFMYLSDVVRPGEQLDRRVNQGGSLTALLNGTPVTAVQQAAPLFRQTDFWAQGINFGFELRY